MSTFVNAVCATIVLISLLLLSNSMSHRRHRHTLTLIAVINWPLWDFDWEKKNLYTISGEVELENLPLRKDALRNLGLPLQALRGTVGRIKLQIPVRQFRTAPWCILIENVYVVIGPVNLDEVRFCDEDTLIKHKMTHIDASFSGMPTQKNRPNWTISYRDWTI